MGIVAFLDNKKQRARAILKDFKRLENFGQCFWQLFNVANDLEWTFKHCVFENRNTITPNHATNQLAIAVFVELNDAFTWTFKRSLKNNLAVWIDHYCPFITKRNNSIADMS